jgi:hypothetical protein
VETHERLIGSSTVLFTKAHRSWFFQGLHARNESSWRGCSHWRDRRHTQTLYLDAMPHQQGGHKRVHYKCQVMGSRQQGTSRAHLYIPCAWGSMAMPQPRKEWYPGKQWTDLEEYRAARARPVIIDARTTARSRGRRHDPSCCIAESRP